MNSRDIRNQSAWEYPSNSFFPERTFSTGPIDENDNPVKKTKHSHPYSYDGFVLHRMGDNSESNGTVYSDRLSQWDRKKHDSLWEKHCSGCRYDNASPRALEDFLMEYMGSDKLRLILVMEYCNASTGYPVWRLDFNEAKKGHENEGAGKAKPEGEPLK